MRSYLGSVISMTFHPIHMYLETRLLWKLVGIWFDLLLFLKNLQDEIKWLSIDWFTVIGFHLGRPLVMKVWSSLTGFQNSHIAPNTLVQLKTYATGLEFCHSVFLIILIGYELFGDTCKKRKLTKIQIIDP